MKTLGYEISEDGITQWRNNGGIIERKFTKIIKPEWETVSAPSNFNLKKFCKDGNFGFAKTLKEAKSKTEGK